MLPKPDWLQARANWIKKAQEVLKIPIKPDQLYKALHLYYSDYPLGTWDSKSFLSNYLGVQPKVSEVPADVKSKYNMKEQQRKTATKNYNDAKKDYDISLKLMNVN